jgi:hypothetical protein
MALRHRRHSGLGMMTPVEFEEANGELVGAARLSRLWSRVRGQTELDQLWGTAPSIRGGAA